jgi:hypothetical protein
VGWKDDRRDKTARSGGVPDARSPGEARGRVECMAGLTSNQRDRMTVILEFLVATETIVSAALKNDTAN